MSSSYLESLGRRELEPYSNEKLNYEETEPDLTKTVNAQIDANIQDRKQFFQDNINLYNQTQSFSKLKGNLASLQGLIPSIAKIKTQADNFKAQRVIINQILDDYKNEEKKAKFAQITIKEEELNQELENNENTELGTIDKTRAQNPGKIGTDTSGEQVGPVEYIALKNRLANEKLQNPINAKNNLAMEWDMFWAIAQDSMTVGGLLWKDTPLDQKDEFMREAAGVFISEYTAKTGITDRALVTTFAPIFEKSLGDNITKSVSIEEDAVNKYYQDADDSKTWQYYNNSAKVFKESNGKVKLSGVFERNTWIKNSAAYLKSIGHPEPMREANRQWNLMIKRGIKAKLIDDNTLNFLFQYYKFKPDGGGPEVNYETLQPNAVAELRTYYNDQKKNDNLDDQKSAVDAYIELAEANKAIPRDWRQYITNPELVTVMEKLEDEQKKTNLQKEDLDNDDIQLIANLADGRIKSNPKFKNKLKDYTWLYHKQSEVMKAIGEDFVKIKKKYVEQMGQDQTKANELTIQDITKNIKEGKYDGDVNLEILETDKLSARSVVKAVEIYKKGKLQALYSNETHDLEEPHIVNGLKYLDPTDDSVTELPGYFYAVEKLFPNHSAIDILHIRALKTGKLKEPIDRLMQIKDYSMVAPEVRNLLTNKPNATNVLIAASTITSDDQLNQFFEKLVTNEAGLHGTVHAHKYSGQWESELPDGRMLGDLTNGEVLALLKDDKLSDIGMYGFTRFGLLSVFNEFSDIIDLDAKFDRRSQTYFLMYRFFQKSNEGHLMPRRLLKFNEEDQKKFRDLAYSINPKYISPMNNPACLSEVACNELIQIVIPE